jgi:pSer/pThr/pTyr-binding forkhead associated (FHA) protein
MKRFALRFISGKYQGSEFPLPGNAELTIGRSGELDMVLTEDMVSRRHAKLVVNGDQVIIQDLDSTNGTFVNGERIKRARLKEGDRLLIGTSIAKLISTSVAGSDQPERSSKLQELSTSRRTSQTRSMSGALEEIPLPDLLQLFGSSKKTAVLVIRSHADIGKICLENGVVAYASINDSKELSPSKCAYRIVNWKYGSFDMNPAKDHQFPERLDLPAEAILMEGMRIYDEMQRLGSDLPPMDATLSPALPLEQKLRDLSSEELDVFQYTLGHPLTEELFNNCPLDDLLIAQTVVSLSKKGYLKVSKSLSEEARSITSA